MDETDRRLIATLRGDALTRYTKMQQRNLLREEAPYRARGGGGPCLKKRRGHGHDALPRCSTVGFTEPAAGTPQAASVGYTALGGNGLEQQW